MLGCDNSEEALHDINCSKKVWNITFALNFCTYSFIIFTWVLHVLKYCSFPYILQKTTWKSIRWEQNNSLPNAVGVKIKSCKNPFSWTLNCIDCIGVKKVGNVLSGLTNDDSCNFWFWPLPYSTMSISIIPQSISKRFSITRRELIPLSSSMSNMFTK